MAWLLNCFEGGADGFNSRIEESQLLASKTAGTQLLFLYMKRPVRRHGSSLEVLREHKGCWSHAVLVSSTPKA